MLFFFPSCKKYFVLNAWLSTDGTNIPKPLSLGRKRVSRAIVSAFLLFHKKLKIVLFIYGSRSLGSENTLHTNESLENNIVFIIMVFPLRKKCLWFCTFTLFSIFWIHFLMLYLLVISMSLLKWTKSIMFHFLGICCYCKKLNLFGLIIPPFYLCLECILFLFCILKIVRK